MSEHKHYLIGGGEPLLLPTATNLSIGRNPNNGLVVPDPHVSRNHAEIFYDGSRFVLSDLNSSKGTRVNGKAITSHVLQEGDVIAVGQYSWTYRVIENDEQLRGAMRAQRKLAAVQSTLDGDIPAEAAAPQAEKDFSGSLEAMDAKTLCALLHEKERSGILAIASAAGPKMKVYFLHGQIRRAESAQSEGDETVVQMLRTVEGTFSFQASIVPVTPNITTDTRVFLGLPAAEKPTVAPRVIKISGAEETELPPPTPPGKPGKPMSRSQEFPF